MWCVGTFFQVQIQYLVQHRVVKERTCVGLASRTVSCPELRRSASDSAVLLRAMAGSAYRPLLAWSSVIHSWVLRYLKLAAQAQDRGTHWCSISCCYIGDGCSSGSNLRSSWRSLYLLSDTLSALSLTHVYLYRCNYWTYLHVPHSTVR